MEVSKNEYGSSGDTAGTLLGSCVLKLAMEQRHKTEAEVDSLLRHRMSPVNGKQARTLK